MTELKLVKQAHLRNENDLIKVVHYDTVIFSYNRKTGEAHALKDCSVTSNKQIRYALDFFKVDPKKYTQSFNGEKWGFHK